MEKKEPTPLWFEAHMQGQSKSAGPMGALGVDLANSKAAA